MKKKLVACTLTCLFLVSTAAFADSINTRPVTVNPSTDGDNLQTILNNIYGCTGCVDAYSDQSSAALWTLPVKPPITMDLQMEATFSTELDAVGIYTDNSLLDIFTFSAATGDSAALTFNGDGTVTISGSDCTAVHCGTFSGIDQNDFGFYLTTGRGLEFFTEDSKNGGTAHALAYVDPSDLWTFAFEDGTDFDYNDRVITATSITAVPEAPEPASFLLLGFGLLGLVGRSWRKRFGRSRSISCI